MHAFHHCERPAAEHVCLRGIEMALGHASLHDLTHPMRHADHELEWSPRPHKGNMLINIGPKAMKDRTGIEYRQFAKRW